MLIKLFKQFTINILTKFYLVDNIIEHYKYKYYQKSKYNCVYHQFAHINNN